MFQSINSRENEQSVGQSPLAGKIRVIRKAKSGQAEVAFSLSGEGRIFFMSCSVSQSHSSMDCGHSVPFLVPRPQ